MSHSSELLINFFLTAWACTASLSLLGWMFLIATTGTPFPADLPKKPMILFLITTIVMTGLIATRRLGSF